MKRCLPIVAFALLAFARPWTRTEPCPLATGRPVASLIPDRCRIYLEGPGLGAVMEQGLAHPFVAALRTSALARVLLAERPGVLEQALVQAEAWLGAPVLAAIGDVTRAGIGLGIDPATKAVVVAAIGSDAEQVRQRLGGLLDALERQSGHPGALDAPHARWSGAEVWFLGEEGVIAHRAELTVVGNDRELVAETLELAAEPDARGLLDRPGFATHQTDRPSDTTLWAWLELAELEPFADEGGRELRAAHREPAAQALLGAEIGALLAARSLSLALTVGGSGLELRARAFEAPCATALVPLARAGELPAEIGGAAVGRALLYRDYARFFTERDRLFPLEALPGFAEALTNGALFFEGQDLGAEVLPHLSPWLRLVSQPADFAPERRPEIPLPAVAVVAVLDDPRIGEQWAAAFQTILALLNVDRAQKGGKGMRLQLASEGETEISTARFATPGPSDGVDLRYNLEPALAVVGRHLVLGTHLSLVRELVRELEGAEPAAAGDARETLELDARAVGTFLELNLEPWIAHEMLAKGLERAAAEAKVEKLRLALASFAGLRIAVESRDPAAPEVRLELTLARNGEAR